MTNLMTRRCMTSISAGIRRGLHALGSAQMDQNSRALVRIVAIVALPIALSPSCAKSSPRDRFERTVLPLIEGRCGATACHGVAEDAEQRGEVIDWSHFHLRVTPLGRAVSPGAAYENVKARIDTSGVPDLSTFLRKPLRLGLVHAGGAVFGSRDDPAYRAIRDWIAEESGGGEGGRLEDLPEATQRFARDVLPLLANKQCMNAGCHATPAPFTSFEPPMELDGQLLFSFDAIKKNHAAARMHLHLGGDVLLSRLLRKGLPIGRGGVVHRGGNDIFFDSGTEARVRDEPAVRAIVGWAEAERGALPALRGFVYVRGPVAPSSPFEHDAFVPGTDLWALIDGRRQNLTASLHPGGPADVRDPAVRHDGARIVFAMRRSVDEPHQLWELGVDGRAPKQLTSDARALPGGGFVANVQPTYGPDGRVYFVSTRAGHLAEGLAALDTEIWAIDPQTLALERITHGPSPEVTPSFIPTGKSYGTLAFTELRALGGRHRGVVLRMPLDHNRAHHGDAELHIHHGNTADGEVLYAMRTLPDGRFAATLLDRTSAWRGGQLVVFDRQLGPQIASGAEGEASLPAYRRPFAALGPGSGIDRHPVPLPDGRIVVAHADEPGRFVLQALTLEETASGPIVAARATLLADDEPVFDAEPIVARPLEDPPHPAAWDPHKTTGTLAYRHVEVLESIFTSLEPRGRKTLRADLRFARLIESVPLTPKDLAAGPISLGTHGRARILAEVPLAGGSLQVEVPAHTAFRVQTLDASRMAVGAQHARWVDVFPGETFPGGVSPVLYPSLCAGCHGALSGKPAEVFSPVPDLITGASITLATHHNLDPRRPLPPFAVGPPLTIDFRRDVAPLIARSCVKCHSGFVARPTKQFDAMYEALFPHVVESSAASSPLIQRVAGGPCAGEPPLSPEERLSLVRWIDLGAVYRGLP